MLRTIILKKQNFRVGGQSNLPKGHGTRQMFLQNQCGSLYMNPSTQSDNIWILWDVEITHHSGYLAKYWPPNPVYGQYMVVRSNSQDCKNRAGVMI